MPYNEIDNSLQKAGIDIESDDNYMFNRYDSLATFDDLGLLFDALESARDKTGRTVMITPVSIAENPDFEKI